MVCCSCDMGCVVNLPHNYDNHVDSKDTGPFVLSLHCLWSKHFRVWARAAHGVHISWLMMLHVPHERKCLEVPMSRIPLVCTVFAGTTGSSTECAAKGAPAGVHQRFSLRSRTRTVSLGALSSKRCCKTKRWYFKQSRCDWPTSLLSVSRINYFVMFFIYQYS